MDTFEICSWNCYRIRDVNNIADPIIDPASVWDSATEANSSTAWSITNVQCKADVVELDSAVNETFAQNLLRDNGSLYIQFNSYISQVQSLPTGAKDVNINVQRTVSRLSTVFVTLYKPLKSALLDQTYCFSKCWNTFYKPIAVNAGLRVDDFNDDAVFSEYRRQGYPSIPN